MQSNHTAASMIVFAWLSVAQVALIGCGCVESSASVSGSISLDGVELETGWIMFIPVEGTPGGIAGSSVEEGAYSIVGGLRPGKYRVEIRQPRPSKRAIPKPFGAPGETIEGTEEAIEEAFNENSTLRADLGKGANTVDFVVTHRR